MESYRTYRSSGYGTEVLRNYRITEVPGRYTNAVCVHRVLRNGRNELTEVSGTGMNVGTKLTKVPGTDMNVVHNLQMLRYE